MPSEPEAPPSPLEGEPAALLAALPAHDAELAAFAAAAAAAQRRMDVALITVGGVDAEKDPGKRLEVRRRIRPAVAGFATCAADRAMPPNIRIPRELCFVISTTFDRLKATRDTEKLKMTYVYKPKCYVRVLCGNHDRNRVDTRRRSSRTSWARWRRRRRR